MLLLLFGCWYVSGMMVDGMVPFLLCVMFILFSPFCLLYSFGTGWEKYVDDILYSLLFGGFVLF
jgi:hypothetical protein